MPAAILDAVIFPHALVAVAARGKKRWYTAIGVNQGGFEERNAIWTRPRREYELGLVPRTVGSWAAIDALHDVVQGSLYGFLLQDPTNNACTVANGLMRPLPAALSGSVGATGATGVGYGLPNYRLLKRQTSAAVNHDRDIRKPQSGAVTLYRGGSPVTLGAAAGNAAIDAVNGNVAFVADTSEAMTSITIGASTVLNFSGGAPVVAAFSVGERVYVSGVTGSAAAALNGLSHAISAKGATSLTISTSTASLAVTAAGTAYKYPQASETLTWAGSFYVPVRFRDDDIDWEIVAGGPISDNRLVLGPSVILLEVLLP